jgi:hypothetical protein
MDNDIDTVRAVILFGLKDGAMGNVPAEVIDKDLFTQFEKGRYQSCSILSGA